MNISPDDFEKFGIDDSVLDEKGEQTTYKIKYVTRYVRQWALIEVNRKEIQQINFIDCMCNAGVYKDGDACTALEVIGIFNELAKQFPSKRFVVYLNDINSKRIDNFNKIYQKHIVPQKSLNLLVYLKDKDVNDYLDMIIASSQNKQGLFAYGKCNLIYVDPYNFGTVQISKLHNILEKNYCELLFNLFTSDYVRNIAKDTGRIQKCLGGFKPATKDEFINYVVNELRVGHIQYTFAYSFHTVKNVELYQILYATPNIRGLEVLKDSLWDVFDGEEFHRNHAPKISDVEQISMFDDEDPKEQRLREYAQEARRIICEEFKGQIVEYAVIEQKILEETMLKDSQIIEPVLKPLIDEEKIRKCNNVRKTNFKKDSYAFI
jgi:three-Cys-motif partner protein